jgi:hypothetical protein
MFALVPGAAMLQRGCCACDRSKLPTHLMVLTLLLLAAAIITSLSLLLLLLLLLLCCHYVTPGPLCTWYRPTNLDQLLTLKSAHNDLKLVGGNSEVSQH